MLNKEKYLEKYCEKELELEERDECIAEKVIFSCSTEDEKEEIIVKFKELSEDKVREAFEIKEEEECNIEFDEAPEPKEINWEHINYPDHHRLGRQIIGWLLTSLFLASITVVFFFVLCVLITCCFGQLEVKELKVFLFGNALHVGVLIAVTNNL